MLKVLKYIVIFLLGYKILKDLFKYKQNKEVAKHPDKQRVTYKEQTNTTTDNGFNNAETIEYEELK